MAEHSEYIIFKYMGFLILGKYHDWKAVKVTCNLCELQSIWWIKNCN